MIDTCTMTCPRCGHQKQETMAPAGRELKYLCRGCGTRLEPKPGDCCVYCSWSDVICPEMQEKRNCCPGDEVPTNEP